MNYVEILEHRLFNAEQKNAQLQKENEELKKLIKAQDDQIRKLCIDEVNKLKTPQDGE